MNGCQTCGGFGGHHDPIAHDAEPDRCDNCGQRVDVCGGCIEDFDDDAHDALHPWYFAGCGDCEERADRRETSR